MIPPCLNYELSLRLRPNCRDVIGANAQETGNLSKGGVADGEQIDVTVIEAVSADSVLLQREGREAPSISFVNRS